MWNSPACHWVLFQTCNKISLQSIIRANLGKTTVIIISVQYVANMFTLVHCSPHLRLQQENKASVTGTSQAGEAYHYVSYLPVNGRLYEMDGLKPWPLDHGEAMNIL